MAVKQSIVTWQILEDQEWEAMHRSRALEDPPTAGPPRHSGRLLLVLAMVLVVLVAGAGGYLQHEGRLGLDQVQAEIQHTAERENQAWQQGDVVLATALTDGPRTWADWRLAQWLAEVEMGVQPRPDGVGVRVQHMELHGDLALVEVIELRQAVPYRETRVYRQIGPEWLRTTPQPDLWGAERTAETEHFRFVYRQRDAAAVAAVMAEVEDLYAGLRRIVGLGPPTPDQRFTVEVVAPAVLPVDVFLDQMAPTGYRLQVLSPFLIAAPAQFTPAEALRQTITGYLGRQVMTEGVGSGLNRCEGQLMAHGLHLWLRRDSGGEQPAQRAALERDLQRWLAQNPLPGLAGLAALPYDTWAGIHQQTPVFCPADTPRMAAALTVVAYAMEAYGRERLPALLAGFSHHDTWEALIPAAFGVPVAEFEAGWWAYLAARYAGPPPSPSLPANPGY